MRAGACAAAVVSACTRPQCHSLFSSQAGLELRINEECRTKFSSGFKSKYQICRRFLAFLSLPPSVSLPHCNLPLATTTIMMTPDDEVLLQLLGSDIFSLESNRDRDLLCLRYQLTQLFSTIVIPVSSSSSLPLPPLPPHYTTTPPRFLPTSVYPGPPSYSTSSPQQQQQRRMDGIIPGRASRASSLSHSQDRNQAERQLVDQGRSAYDNRDSWEFEDLSIPHPQDDNDEHHTHEVVCHTNDEDEDCEMS